MSTEYDNVGRNGLPRAISHGPEEDEERIGPCFLVGSKGIHHWTTSSEQ